MLAFHYIFVYWSLRSLVVYWVWRVSSIWVGWFRGVHEPLMSSSVPMWPWHTNAGSGTLPVWHDTILTQRHSISVCHHSTRGNGLKITLNDDRLILTRRTISRKDLLSSLLVFLFVFLWVLFSVRHCVFKVMNLKWIVNLWILIKINIYEWLSICTILFYFDFDFENYKKYQLHVTILLHVLNDGIQFNISATL